MKTVLSLFVLVCTLSAAHSQQTVPAGGITVRADRVLQRPGKKHALNKTTQAMTPNDVNPAGEGDTVGLGFGFNVFTGELLNTQCMVGDIIPDDPTDHKTASTTGAIRDVSSLTQYRNTTNTSASASLTYKIFSIGGGGSAYSTDFFQSYYRYLNIEEETVNRSAAYANAGVTRLVGRYNAQRFKDTCGQMYVQKVLYGASLRSLVQLATTYKDTETHHDVQVSAGITALLSASVDTATATSQIAQNSEFSQLISVVGVPAGNLPNLASLVQFAYAFPNLGKDGDKAVGYVLMPYKTAANPPSQAEDVPEAAMQLIGNLAEKHDEAVQQRNDLRFAKGKTGKLYQLSETDRKTQLDSTEGYLVKIATAVDTCEKQLIDACTTAVQGVGPVPDATLIRVQ